ncbi:MAG: hypothetical protein KDI74_04760 [Gammaproteobacteria bacterium]|nr:hypothetical protein [Gammaproteobacteria bacterium]
MSQKKNGVPVGGWHAEAPFDGANTVGIHCSKQRLIRSACLEVEDLA